MAIKTITWQVGEDAKTLTPTQVQDGGVQGEDNATVAVFNLPAILQTGYDLYLEYVDPFGGYDTTAPLPVTDGQLRFPLPRAWTQHGGEGTLRLVAAATDGLSLAYTLEARVRFHKRAGAWGRLSTVLQQTVQGLLARCTAAVKAAEGFAQAAQKAATGANLVHRQVEKARQLRLTEVCDIPHGVQVSVTTPWYWDVAAIVTGKNLLTTDSVDAANWPNSAWGGRNSSLGCRWYDLAYLGPGEYVFSLDCPGDSIPFDAFSLQVSTDGGKTYTDHWLYGTATYNDGVPYRRQVPFTLNTGDKARLWLKEMAGGYETLEVYQCTRCQLEYGSQATAYEPPMASANCDDLWVITTPAPEAETRIFASVAGEMNLLTLPTWSGANPEEVTYVADYIARV